MTTTTTEVTSDKFNRGRTISNSPKINGKPPRYWPDLVMFFIMVYSFVYWLYWFYTLRQFMMLCLTLSKSLGKEFSELG